MWDVREEGGCRKEVEAHFKLWQQVRRPGVVVVVVVVMMMMMMMHAPSYGLPSADG